MKRLIIASLFILFGAKIFPQEIGFSPTKMWTNNYEIRNPIGYSIFVNMPIKKVGFKLEYVAAKNDRNYFGFMNSGFLIDEEDFVQESITSKSSFHAFEFSMHVPRLYELYQNYLDVGVGITFDKFTRNKLGLSSGKNYTLSENKFGVFYAVSLSRYDLFGLPIKLEILFKHKSLAAGSYTTDSDQPFTGAMDIKELQLNFAYIF